MKTNVEMLAFPWAWKFLPAVIIIILNNFVSEAKQSNGSENMQAYIL